MSKVHVFGLDHFHQNLETLCHTPTGISDEQRQKLGLKNTLQDIVIENHIELIAEEGKLGHPCLGQFIAQENGLKHIDITMPLHERQKQGIQTPQYDRQEATRKVAYQRFEQYMFDQVKAAATNSVLVMCGCFHLNGLAYLFKTAGHDVRCYCFHRAIP